MFRDVPCSWFYRRLIIVYEKLRFKMFFVRPFSNSSDFMRVFEKLRFRDGLLSVDSKPNRNCEAPFSSGVVWTGP